jgi:uncharacterized membrane protein/predicted RNA-binding Zn-ribbon protein involved in translation (DUF1610 family)
MRLEYTARKCLKCGHLRESSEPAPEYACPKCGAVYAKLEAARIADLEARELEARETRSAAIRAESDNRFEADERKRDAKEAPLRTAAHAIYVLYVLPFALTQFGGLMLAYKMRRLGDDSWLNDHFTWQIRTFWYLLAPSIVGVVALLIGGAATSAFLVTRQARFLEAAFNSVRVLSAVATVIVLVYVFRVLKGWYSLWRQSAPW